MSHEYVPLKTANINPNRARWQSVGLCVLAGLIALFTVKSNYTYFSIHHAGWDFWLRVIAFSSVELTLILLPLFKGWGNPRQITMMWIAEGTIMLLSFVHTAYVNDSTHTRVSAERSKNDAANTFKTTTAAAQEIAATNERLRAEYNKSLTAWRRAANTAQANNQAPPPMPAEPAYIDMPQVGQDVVKTMAVDIEQKVESAVPHRFLLGLLQVMIGLVAITWTFMAVLSDSARVLMAQLKHRSRQVTADLEATKSAAVTGQSIVKASPRSIPTAGGRIETTGQLEAAVFPKELRSGYDDNPFPKELPEVNHPNAPRRQ